MDDNIESESIFDSFNLNPQLFINVVINNVDDTIYEGFDYLEKEALLRFGDGVGEEGREEISEGVSSIRDMILEALEKRMDAWERFCLTHCFSVPKGLSLPETNASEDSLIQPNLLLNSEKDHELASLREKLSVAQKESIELQKEYNALSKESVSKRHIASMKEALSQQISVQDMFQESDKAAAEIRAYLRKLKDQKIVEMQCAGTEGITDSNKDQTKLLYINGLSDEDQWHLQRMLTDL